MWLAVSLAGLHAGQLEVTASKLGIQLATSCLIPLKVSQANGMHSLRTEAHIATTFHKRQGTITVQQQRLKVAVPQMHNLYVMCELV